MTNSPGPSRFTSTGRPGRIIGALGSGIDVHIDVIKSINRSSKWERTQTALEQGAALSVHRQRTPEPMSVEILICDTAPRFGALAIGRWENDHTTRTVQRLKEAQAAEFELRVWDGRRYQRTPAGIQVWVLDDIEGPTWQGQIDTSTGLYSAFTLKFGESPRFVTTFTPASANVSEDLQDVVGDSSERGRQSTTEAGSDLDSQLAGGVY